MAVYLPYSVQNCKLIVPLTSYGLIRFRGIWFEDEFQMDTLYCNESVWPDDHQSTQSMYTVPEYPVTSCDTGCVQSLFHDDVIKWKHFLRYWPFVQGLYRSPVNSPAKRSVTRSFDIFFELRLNKRLSKQWWGWWFDTPSCPLWRQCNGFQRRVSSLLGAAIVLAPSWYFMMQLYMIKSSNSNSVITVPPSNSPKNPPMSPRKYTNIT